MALWIAISGLGLTIGIGYAIYKRFKEYQDALLRQRKVIEVKDITVKKHIKTLQEKDGKLKEKDEKLKEKDGKLKEKDEKLKTLRKENTEITAKYHKKLKAAEVKKKNQAKYREKKKKTRSLKEQVEEIVGKGPKWLPHSNSGPASHKMGKPKGSNGGGRSRPEAIHKTIDLFPIKCPRCLHEFKDEKTFFVYDKVMTEFENNPDEIGYYMNPRIINIRQNIHRCKCPVCKNWVYPDLGLFKNARFGPGFVSYVIDHRIRFSDTYEDIIAEMGKYSVRCSH